MALPDRGEGLVGGCDWTHVSGGLKLAVTVSGAVMNTRHVEPVQAPLQYSNT